ncbi:glycosyl transferase, partial [Candidatus Roizmanbacteria bacterium CG10_big_fil_rev_8_21_14_0_10_39_12]
DFVLEVLTQSKNIDEIICVNDASTDGGEKNLLKKFPSIRLIHTKTNSGKSHAIKLGLDKAIGSYILLMDADLLKLKHTEIDTIIAYMKNHPSVDMLLLKDSHPHWITKMTRHDIVLTGKRILKSKDLKQVFAEMKPKKYQIEVGINIYMVNHHKNVIHTQFSCSNTVKTDKIGFISGSLSNLRMLNSIVFFTSFWSYLRQIFLFGHDEVSLSS